MYWKKTKQIEQYQAQTKTYTGTLVLGSTTPSYDLETEVDTTYRQHITEKLIHQTTKQFEGKIQQQPLFSALKKDGKRLYEFARAGKDVTIPTRKFVSIILKSKPYEDTKLILKYSVVKAPTFDLWRTTLEKH